MTYDEFVTEYHSVSARTLQFLEKGRRDGLLAMEDMINREKVNQRDILEYGIQFVIDGTDNKFIDKILSNIIAQEDDKYTRQLMLIKKEAVLMINEDYNPGHIAQALNSLTDISLSNDPLAPNGKKGKIQG